MTNDLYIIVSIIFFLSALIYLNSILPISQQFISITSLITFILATAGTVGFCMIATGIPCAIAMGVSVGVTWATSTGLISLAGVTLSSNYEWLNSIILTPLSFILSLFSIKLARGTG